MTKFTYPVGLVNQYTGYKSDDDPIEISTSESHDDVEDVYEDSAISFYIYKIGWNSYFYKFASFMAVVTNVYMLNAVMTAVNYNLPSYQTTIDSYFEMAMTNNLPFCETSFAVTPLMAQGASALAHLPYVPAFLLGLIYASPATIPMLDNIYGEKTKRLLWAQFALQMFTSIGGHMLPNPRAVMNQEISIVIAFYFLFSFLELTTPKKSTHLFKQKTFILFTSMFMLGYFVIGLMPIIFTGFAATVMLSFLIQDAFGLITEQGRNILLATFVPTAVVLLIETTSCDWLQSNISNQVPWHLLFDIMFWQVVGSAIDVIVISPRPGKFLMIDD